MHLLSMASFNNDDKCTLTELPPFLLDQSTKNGVAAESRAELIDPSEPLTLHRVFSLINYPPIKKTIPENSVKHPLPDGLNCNQEIRQLREAEELT